MKKLSVVGMLFGSLICGTVQAQTSPLKFAQEVWDFGQIREEDGKVSHAFEFTNTGSTPVVIEKVTVVCGCTQPEYDKAPIRPGEKGTITITYDPAGRPGAFRRDITVQSGGTTGRNVITVAGTVNPRPQDVGELYPVKAGELLLSYSSVNLGYVPRGTVKSTAITCYNPTDRPLALGVVYGDGRKKSYCDVSLSTQKLAPGQQGVITATYDLKGQDLWGVLTAGFSLMVDGALATPELGVSGVATDDFSGMTAAEMERAPKAEFSSQYHNFGLLKAGVEQRRDFTVKNTGGEPLVIRDMKLGPRMSTTLDPLRQIAPGEEVAFSVMMGTKNAPAGKLMDHVVLILNDPWRPMREIRLAATIEE